MVVNVVEVACNTNRDITSGWAGILSNTVSAEFLEEPGHRLGRRNSASVKATGNPMNFGHEQVPCSWLTTLGTRTASTRFISQRRWPEKTFTGRQVSLSARNAPLVMISSVVHSETTASTPRASRNASQHSP